MKNLSCLATVVCAVLLLTGCGGRAEPTPANQGRVHKLTLAIPRDTGPLNLYSSDSSADYLVELVFDKLLAPSPYVDKPIPGLAESVTQLDP